MLSNKLTFSLASLIVLLMVGLCLPASAQIIQVPTTIALPVPTGTFDANDDGDTTDADDTNNGEIGAARFVVYSEAAQAGSGIAAPAAAPGINQIQIPTPGLLDLEAFFRFGGTLALVGDPAILIPTTAMADPAGGTTRPIGPSDLVISEIMWALDVDNPETPGDEIDGGTSSNVRRQWIEIYNTLSDDNGSPMKTPVIANAGDLSLIFIPYRHVEGDANILAAGDTTVAGYIVLDVMSNLQFGKWDLPGMSGNTTPPTANPQDPPLAPLVSVYRNINYDRVQGINVLNNDNTVNTALNRDWQIHLNDSIRNGYLPGSWIASDALGQRNTISYLFVGSPGAPHVPGIVYEGAPRSELPAEPAVIITEVRNDNSPANIDWVELHNPGIEPVGLWDYELTLIQGADGGDPGDDIDASDTDTVLVGFDAEYTPAERRARGFPPNADFRLEPGEYLLIVNRDPRETVLADGVDIGAAIAGRNVNAGTSHQYIIRPMLDLPDGGISLILRDHVGRNAQHADHPNKHRVADARATTDTASSLNIVDYVGGFRHAVTTNEYNTQVWPFRGWTSRTRDDGHTPRGIPANTTQSVARRLTAEDSTIYRLGNDGGGDDRAWNAVGSVGGIGYDPGVDRRIAPGTPGYANNPVRNALVDNNGTFAITTDDLLYDGEISISEVMYDAGPRWNLIQWIEIYNSSMTQVVNLAGWELEIRNATDAVESYVDSSFVFNAATILPNQTLLVVSGTGTNDVPANRVYNLHEHHRRALGLTNRRSVLLSPEGFYLRLRAPIPHAGRGTEWEMIDSAGNVVVEGATRTVMWELPETNADARQSLVRQYGTRELYDGTRDSADLGTMAESWKSSDLTGAGISFYGHRDDISTPGYRLGGPLPVSLSKFRPARDENTGHVVVRWVTESELNNAGFNILRSESKTGEFKVVNVKGIIAGHGTTSEQHVYEWTDTTAKPNVVYYYQIEDVSLNGHRTALATTRLKGHISASGKLTTRWSELKSTR